MQIIDADALVRDHGDIIEDEDGFPTCVVYETDIRHYPTIDAVPVVRCKDCEYYEGDECVNPYVWMSDGAHLYTAPDDFCSYGERRRDA